MGLKSRSSWLVFALLVLGSFEVCAQDTVVTWATNPQYPPYDWATDEGAYDGACVELLSLLVPQGYVFRPVLVPWRRAQEMAKAGQIDLLVNLRVTPERSEWLQFSANPTFYNPISVFMRKDEVIPFRSWDELKPLRGGVSLGDTFGNGFDAYLAANLTVEVVPTLVENFRKLDSGRIDYFVSGHYMGLAWLSSAKISSITALTPPISNDSIHLGFSRLSPHRDLLPEIDRKLAQLKADGTLDRLLAQYLKKFTNSPLSVFPQ